MGRANEPKNRCGNCPASTKAETDDGDDHAENSRPVVESVQPSRPFKLSCTSARGVSVPVVAHVVPGVAVSGRDEEEVFEDDGLDEKTSVTLHSFVVVDSNDEVAVVGLEGVAERIGTTAVVPLVEIGPLGARVDVVVIAELRMCPLARGCRRSDPRSLWWHLGKVERLRRSDGG